MLGMASCAAPPRRMDASLVQVPAIIGALKCAFATALMKEKASGQIRRLEGTVASGTLTLNIVHKDTKAFNVQAKAVTGGPFVFSFANGTGSLLPKFSHSTVATNTIKTEIDFRYYMWADDKEVCDAVGASVKARYGFTEWLATIVAGLDEHSGTYPFGQADALKYDAQFGVVAKDSAGLDFDVVFLSGGLNAETERSDIQSIKFTIAAVSDKNPRPDIWRKGYGERNP